LGEKQQDALAASLGEEALAALLETGDDAAFLAYYSLGFGQHRDATGHIVQVVLPAAGHQERMDFPVQVTGGHLNWFYYAALIYALFRGAMALRRRRSANEEPA